MLPLWQAEFGIGYAALGLLRTCYSGTMAGFQIPSALVSERLGLPLVLARRHRAVGHRLSDRRRQHRLLDAGDRAPDRRARLQHAASAGVGAGRARLRRSALAEGARHLQLRRRHRQDVGAGGGLAAAGAAALAAGGRHPGLRRPRGGGCDLLAGAALAGRSPRRGDSERKRPRRRGRRRQPLRLSGAAVDRHDRQRDPHGLSDLPAVHPDLEGREPADGRPRADAGVRRRRRGQARLRLHRRADRRDRDGVPDRRPDHRWAFLRCCRCRSRPRWCCCR